VDSFDRGFPTKGVIAGFDHDADTSSGVKIIEGPIAAAKRNDLKKQQISLYALLKTPTFTLR
jgi:hypothetical protein